MSLKRVYEAPTIEVVELKTEGFICLSGELEGYGDVIEI
jgi:hypothetical protein